MKIDMKRIEAGLIDAISAVTPWLAPLIPAYLVYTNMVTQLGYPPLFGLIGAAAVEFLGLSAVHTAVTFWQYNDGRKERRAPVLIAVCAGLFYIVIVLTVNAALDISNGSKETKIFSHALLSLLSVDAAIIIAIRAQHARRVTEAQDERNERRAEREAAKAAKQASQPAPQPPAIAPQVAPVAQDERKPNRKAQFMADMRGRNGAGPLTTAQIMAQYKVSERAAQYWLAEYAASREAVSEN